MYMSEDSRNSHKLSDEDWERLARYIAGESDPGETAGVRAWLADNPDHALLAEALEIKTPVRRSALSDADIESALGKVKARIRKPGVLPLETRRKSIWQSPALRIAAAIVIVAGAALIIRSGSTGIVTPNLVAEHFATPVGEQREIRLRDGSTVLLAPQSRLDVAPTYATGPRAVSLRGGAYFDVRHDPSRAFSVSIGRVIVRDVGTSFVVRQVD